MCRSVRHPLQEAVFARWLRGQPTLNIINVLVNCWHSSAELAWHGGVYLRSADASLLVGSCCCCLCSSVLVLAQDSWSPAASGLYLLHSITPADFLGPERNLTDRGEELCQLHCRLYNLMSRREENERFGEEMKIEPNWKVFCPLLWPISVENQGRNKAKTIVGQ